MQKKLCAFILLLSMLLPIVCSCSVSNGNGDEDQIGVSGGTVSELDRISTKTAPVPKYPNYDGAATVRIGLASDKLCLSPFFSDSEELGVVSLLHPRLLSVDRNGRVIINGINGQTTSYEGEDHVYNSIADVQITEQNDGVTVYSFTLNENVFFSDGTNLTADDVIFSMYVLLDPSYRGYSKLRELPISGLDLYRNGMRTLSDIIISDRENNTNSGHYEENTSRFYWNRIEDAEIALCADICTYISTVYGTDEENLGLYSGKWGINILSSTEKKTALSMAVLGCAEWKKDESGEYTGVLTDNNGKSYDCVSVFPSYEDLRDALKTKTPTLFELDGSSLFGYNFLSYVKQHFGVEYVRFFEDMYETTDSGTKSITGIKKTGMYTFRVTLDRYNAQDIYAFTFFVAPLHAYVVRSNYKYTDEKYGFEKGKLDFMKNSPPKRTGAGAFVLEKTYDDKYVLARNVYYYLGVPYMKKAELLLNAVGSDPAREINEGKYDITVTELSDELDALVENENSQSKGKPLSLVDYQGRELGYIGINSQRVSCSGAPGSDESRALRLALCVLFDYYKKASIQSYFGVGASVISVPQSFAEENIQGYIYDADGQEIFKDAETKAEREAALLRAVIGYLKKAGFELDKTGKTVSAAADGASLEYSVYFVEGLDCAEALASAVKDASDALASIGVTLRAVSVASERELEQMLLSGACDMWIDTVSLSAEPDVYSFFHSKSNSPLRVSDKELDSLISGALGVKNESERAGAYSEIFDAARSFGGGVCGYVRNLVLVYSADRVELAEDEQYTVYYSITDDLYRLKMN